MKRDKSLPICNNKIVGIDDYIIHAATLHRQGRLDEAIRIISQAKRLDPNKPEVHFNLGLYYGQTGNLSCAIESFYEAVRCRPTWIEAYIYLIAYTIEAGDIAQAMQYLDKAFIISPKNKALHEQLAIVLDRKAESNSTNRMPGLEKAFVYLQSAISRLKSVEINTEGENDPLSIRKQLETISSIRGSLEFAEEFLATECGELIRKANPSVLNQDFPGSIILSTMPKSGSEYVWMALSMGLNLKPARISYLSDEFIDPERLEKVCKGGFISHGHLQCSEYNRAYLSKYVDRLIVHVRDPRQALISWVHYQRHPDFESLPIETNSGNIKKKFEELIDEFVDPFIISMIGFLQSWIEAEEDKLFDIKILFTRQDDLRNNPESFFHRIMEFYKIHPGLFRMPTPPKKGERHFRTGSTDEWRRVLLPRQLTKVQELVPDKVLEKFGWRR